MKIDIDLKSAVLGLTLGVVTMLAVGATDASSSSQAGRFQCAAGQGILIIVDSVTGKAWAMQPQGVSITGAPGGFFDVKK